MANTRRRFEVVLSFGSLIYLFGLVGFCGGITISAVIALFALVEGEWLGAAGILLLNPLFVGFSCAFWAAIGYPLYKRISLRTVPSRELHGEFVEFAAEEQAAPKNDGRKVGQNTAQATS